MSILGVALNTVGEGFGRSMMPIVVDFISATVLGAIKRPKIFQGVYLRNIVSILPAMGTVYKINGVPELNASTVVMGCLFLAYKAATIYTANRDASRRESGKR